MNNFLQEVTVYIKSLPCSEVNEATFNHFAAKAEEIRQKYQSQVDNCYTCINTKKGNISETPVPGNNTPESLMQFIDQAEQLNRLTNITSFAMGELNANDRMKQNMLNEINSRDLSDKIKLLPNIPEEQYSNDKKNMENGLYGGVNSDKYRNSLGSPEAKSLDEILNNGSEGVIPSGGNILMSNEDYSLSWSYRLINTQVRQLFGKGEVKFNIYEVTALLTNLTSRKITFLGYCCNEVSHFQYSQYSETVIGKLKMRLEPHENNEAVYLISVPANEGVTDPTYSLGPIEKEGASDEVYTPTLTANQSILYSDSVMEIGWDYRFIKTLTCGVPLNPEAKFHQYQINAYLVNKVRKMICFTVCCTEVSHVHDKSGCGPTGGGARFPMRVNPKTTIKETYLILVPINKPFPDPFFTGIASYILN